MITSFILQITSLEEFACFVAIIRGEDIDEAKVKKMVDTLKKSNQDLVKAEQSVEKI